MTLKTWKNTPALLKADIKLLERVNCDVLFNPGGK